MKTPDDHLKAIHQTLEGLRLIAEGLIIIILAFAVLSFLEPRIAFQIKDKVFLSLIVGLCAHLVRSCIVFRDRSETRELRYELEISQRAIDTLKSTREDARRERDEARRERNDAENALSVSERYDLRRVNDLFAKLVEDTAPNEEVIITCPDVFLVMFNPTAGDQVDPLIVPVCEEQPEKMIRYRAGPKGELIIQLEPQTVTLPDNGGTEEFLIVTLINRLDGTQVRLPHGFLTGDVIDVGSDLCVIVNHWHLGAMQDVICLEEDDYRERYLASLREKVPAVHEEHLRGLAQNDDEVVDGSASEDKGSEAVEPPMTPTSS